MRMPWWMVIASAFLGSASAFAGLVAWDNHCYCARADRLRARDIAADAVAEAERLDLVAVAEARERAVFTELDVEWLHDQGVRA